MKNKTKNLKIFATLSLKITKCFETTENRLMKILQNVFCKETFQKKIQKLQNRTQIFKNKITCTARKLPNISAEPKSTKNADTKG